jgi:hypothetical protein
MREILFKAKRVDNGEWVEGMLWKKQYNDGNRIFISCFPNKDDNEQVYVVCPETVSQFTGLRDKHGNRIWENDIVKTKFGRLCKMIWRQTQCFVGWDFVVCDFDFDVNDFSKPPSSWDLYFPENLEVLGSSIDNPELLAER